MWVITDRGFYSVVEHPDDSNLLSVRARVRKDLEELKRLVPGMKIVKSPPCRDYAFRAAVTRREWADALGQLTAAIDYSNFKDSVEARQGKARHDVYLRVWRVLLDLTGGRRRRPAGRQRAFTSDGAFYG